MLFVINEHQNYEKLYMLLLDAISLFVLCTLLKYLVQTYHNTQLVNVADLF